MSDDIAISVENVSKAYRIWKSPAARLISPLQGGLAGLVPARSGAAQWLSDRSTAAYRDFYALRDISLTIRRGESAGIIGRNGSGKSTLLQIIAGTLQPTTGSVKVTGRVAALLELGSGFNPEFTGRENIYLTGAVLGLTRGEIDRKLDEILAFADIGDFIDQPIKTYSSGMTVRVAFAVQTAIDPDILIIDEALSVGDEAFQRKCFARIEHLKGKGTTLLFVSHGAAQVIELCDRAILLYNGSVTGNGAPKEIVNIYHQQIYGRAQTSAVTPAALPAHNAAGGPADPSWRLTSKREFEPGDDSFLGTEQASDSLHAYPETGARISGPRIINQLGQRVDHLRRGHSYYYMYDVTVTSPLRGVRFGAVIKTLLGLEIAGMTTHRGSDRLAAVPEGSQYRIRFEFRCGLLPGCYFLNAGVLALDGTGEEYFAHRLVDACMFRVIYEPDLPVNALVDLLERAEIVELNPELPHA